MLVSHCTAGIISLHVHTLNSISTLVKLKSRPANLSIKKFNWRGFVETSY